VVVGLHRRKDLLRRLWDGLLEARAATPASVRLIVRLVCMDEDPARLREQVKLARSLVDGAAASGWCVTC
jgi:hypothetical protein